ncbi:MAG: hypothetical protein FJY11_02465 [Bacteroidetes bacterium]|nr:hypothetical protein [Bacteroidota bacterium]
MENLRLSEIGRIAKTYGFRGDVLIRLAERITDDFDTIESLFLLVEGRAVPFIIESVVSQGNRTLIVKFRWYDSPESMAEFAGCPVLMIKAEADLPAFSDHRMLEGFTLYDEDGTVRGIITSIALTKHQWLATVDSPSGKSFLVPVHEDLVRGVDVQERTLIIEIPDGLENL